MIYSSLYQNSFVAAIFAFLISIIIFFVFDIAPTIKVKNGQIKHYVNWKYPLIIAILVFLIWYFIIFPPEIIKPTLKKESPVKNEKQIMNMSNWL